MDYFTDFTDLSLEAAISDCNNSKVSDIIVDFNNRFFLSLGKKSINGLCSMFDLSCDSISVLPELINKMNCCYFATLLSNPTLSDIPVKGCYLAGDTYLFPYQINSVAYCEECGSYHCTYCCFYISPEEWGILPFGLDNTVCINEDNLTISDVYNFIRNDTRFASIPIFTE